MSIALAKALKTEKRLNEAIVAGNNLAGWTDEANAINAKLSDQAKQSKVLQHGLSVIDASMDSPIDVEIQGRTLIGLGMSVLDSTKNYVLADKKTKLKWADATTYTGVSKFVGKNEKPSIIRVSNFEGKVFGSLTENPHKAKYQALSSLISPADALLVELPSDHIDKIKTLDTTTSKIANTTSGNIAQQHFSFDIIQAIERNIGRIPKATLAEKVQWVKDNLKSLLANWRGFGSSVGGNKASFSWWVVPNSAWSVSPATHTSGSVALLQSSLNSGALHQYIDSTGFIHFLAYADASDGATASTINTDYIELEIELKPEAVLHDPIVPLYEVDATEYGNILTTWAEAEVLNRYPKVQGVQHLQNPYVMAEGENLLPPFSEWTLHATKTKILSPYEIESDANATSDNTIEVAAKENISYTLSITKTGDRCNIYTIDSSGVATYLTGITATGTNSITFTTPIGTRKIRVVLYTTTVGVQSFKEPILTLGTVSKPFTPRNPSYLFAQTKLGQIGTVKDSLFKQDGLWNVRKVVEKDVVLDGTFSWGPITDKAGLKEIQFNLTNSIKNSIVATKYNGALLKKMSNFDGGYSLFLTTLDSVYTDASDVVRFMISDIDSGFGEAYTPTADEIKAYFNGWQAKTVDANGKPTAWRSLGDGTDAPTQTLAYVSANKAPNYTPYKLSYVLATPKIESVTVEGDISLNGMTQIECGSGVIIREKVTPKLSGNGNYYINSSGLGSLLKNKVEKYVEIYKNTITNDGWIYAKSASGILEASINSANFDTTAEYTLSYLLLDRHLFTANGTEIKAMYDSSLKSVVDTLTERQADLNTVTSVNVQAIAELYKRVKALGG